MTRPINRPHVPIVALFAIACVLGSCVLAWPRESGAVLGIQSHSQRHSPTHTHHRHRTRRTPRRSHTCRQNTRSIPGLPAPMVAFETPYVPGRCDPMHLLPKQAWRMFACVRWRESGDQPNEANGAGMYQFTNQATWNEFRGSFAVTPSDATALQQDIVAYRAWRVEQFLPWNGDPCVGSVSQFGKWGWY